MIIVNGFVFSLGVLIMLASIVTDNVGLAVFGFSLCYFGGL
jgi:hypothetical protein